LFLRRCAEQNKKNETQEESAPRGFARNPKLRTGRNFVLLNRFVLLRDFQPAAGVKNFPLNSSAVQSHAVCLLIHALHHLLMEQIELASTAENWSSCGFPRLNKLIDVIAMAVARLAADFCGEIPITSALRIAFTARVLAAVFAVLVSWLFDNALW
jgi:hypothetical protein